MLSNAILSSYLTKDIYPNDIQLSKLEINRSWLRRFNFLLKDEITSDQLLHILMHDQSLITKLYTKLIDDITDLEISQAIMEKANNIALNKLRAVKTIYNSVALNYLDNSSLITTIIESFNEQTLYDSTNSSGTMLSNGVTLDLVDDASVVSPLSSTLLLFINGVISQTGSLNAFPLLIEFQDSDNPYLDITYKVDAAYISYIQIDMNSFNDETLIVYSDDVKALETKLYNYENRIPLNLTTSKIRLVIARSGIIDAGNFNIANIQLFDNSTEEEGTALCGPYELPDETTMFSLDICSTLPDASSYGIEYSFDNVTYYSYQNNSVPIAEVQETAGTKIDTGEVFFAAITNSIIELDITEKVLNTYYPDDTYQFIIKRNINNHSTLINDTAPGWYLDTDTLTYQTYIELAQDISFTCNSTSITVNDTSYQSTIALQKGFNKVSVDATAWAEVEELLTSESALQGQDPYYPYNTKLLIEGYKYHSSFKGSKVYPDKRECFAFLMQEGTLDVLSNYELIEESGNLYIKVMHSFADNYASETFDVSAQKAVDSATQLYVKLTLKAVDVAPTIHSFEVKTI